ncbi:hypothetical protein DFR70_103176 [Nocardia tenerifensis]|uniref:Excreted virulence factor EspC (Type VII ESX diderm) n=1 Tax=Nocardia tenerifensis TaxID=228006 RepID=A0A318K7A8_9NOCA|nr:hypothetical protein [Nocardia tenerifensis]PXX66428.1 hypothetical protein DFR70_103176 [Nocardia tenerifensis]
MDIDVLSKTVQALRGAEQVLTDALTAMSKEGHGDIGTKTLNDAADSFQRRWRFGLERIGESAKVTAEGVGKCRDAYRDVDTALADVLNQVTGVTDGQTRAKA